MNRKQLSMAFLQSSSTVLSTNHRTIPPSGSTATTQRRFHVSCNGGEKPIDRRNMLLGMGGLYSAANLAHADPIPPPDFSTCHDSVIVSKKSGKQMKVNCCPPLPYKDYIIPAPAKQPRVRMPAHLLSSDDLLNYKKALQLMRDLDTSDPGNPLGFKQQAMIHCAYCNAAYPEDKYPGTDISIHSSWLFFPFHRWYVYFYERILGSLIGDPNFALPFWNWDNPDGMQMPAIFDDPTSPLYDLKRDPSHRPPAIVDLTMGPPWGSKVDARFSKTSDEDQVQRNLAEVHNEMISWPVATTDFMGQAYRAGDPAPETACAGTVERGSHISGHLWVGDPSQDFYEDMGNFYSSGNDPLFYSHHSNVDRMWTIWETLDTPVPKRIDDPDFVNSSFLFYDETKTLVRVTVGDCLDPAKLGYTYYSDVPTPWLQYRQPKKQIRAKIQNLSKQAQPVDKVVFPLTLNQKVRVLVPKGTKGKADEVLVLQNVVSDPNSIIKFTVFVNDEDDDGIKINRPEYAGTFGQIPQNHAHAQSKNKSKTKATLSPSDCNLSFSLKELYENIDIDDEDASVVVTLYPLHNGQDVTIGGIKVVKALRE